jgi:hypothetical protein
MKCDSFYTKLMPTRKKKMMAMERALGLGSALLLRWWMQYHSAVTASWPSVLVQRGMHDIISL